MGLFKFFGNSDNDSSSWSEYLNFDITKILESAEIYAIHNNDDETFNSFEYEAELENKVMNAFDTVRIRIQSKDKLINNQNRCILTFISKYGQITSEDAAFVVNTTAKCCEVKDDNWTDVDNMRINEGAWRGRSFDTKNGMIFIEWDPLHGLSLCITGYENYL